MGIHTKKNIHSFEREKKTANQPKQNKKQKMSVSRIHDQ